MTGPARPKVVILGGGMGALAAAFELSAGDWRSRYASITVFQRGHRLGGKGASSRGVRGRIEEHGLHVLLGYYQETFDLLGRCYAELDRPRTDPGCPIRTWRQAVAPASQIGLMDLDGDRWLPWLGTFSRPPATTASGPALGPWSVYDVAVRSLRLLVDFFRSVAGPAGTPAAGSVRLSTGPRPPAASSALARTDAPVALLGAGMAAAASLLEVLERSDLLRALAPVDLQRMLAQVLPPVRRAVRAAVQHDPGTRRTFQLLDLAVTNLLGITVDGLLVRPAGFAAINHLDYREWLARHGASRMTLESPLLRGMYDLAFAYRDGDPARPGVSAGVALELGTRMFFGFSEAIFWKPQAGMGEVVFAPLYQVLARRGVRVRFFHRVDALRADPKRRSVDAVELGVQARVAAGPDGYQPLTAVKGLPCWPAEPQADQLSGPRPRPGTDLESSWAPPADAGRLTLRRGEDFDVAVFGISVGLIPRLCGELIALDPRWQAMVDRLATVGTQSFQLWLRAAEAQLGWTGPAEVTVSSFARPFDTWASMSQLIDREDWPADDPPRSIAYFCSTLPLADPARALIDPAEQRIALRGRVVDFLDHRVGALLPGVVTPAGFRWELLCDDGAVAGGELAGDPPRRAGPERLDAQYWRANLDPSDLYVQALPGTDQYRLPPGGSGFANLVLAGDWTACGLNIGCLEAATRSGRLAAAAVAEWAENGSTGGQAR